MGLASDDRSPRVRIATGVADARVSATLLDRFNRDYDVPSPGPEFLAERITELTESDLVVLLAQDGGEDVGIAVLRFRHSLWSPGLEAYLAELYVRPERRRSGLGTELMEAVVALCRDRGCDRIELGTDEQDHDAHRLYRRFGFTNFADPEVAEGDRERMYVYEREL